MLLMLEQIIILCELMAYMLKKALNFFFISFQRGQTSLIKGMVKVKTK